MTKEDQILKMLAEIQIEQAKATINLKQQRKEIDIITERVDDHEKNQNKFFGWLSAAGILITGFFSWLWKQI